MVPQLELPVAIMAVRLAHHVRCTHEVKIEQTVYFGIWHWQPTGHNVADDATRAKYPVRFVADNRWLRGPDFLRDHEDKWPGDPADMLCHDGTERVQTCSVQQVCTVMPIPKVHITRFGEFDRVCRSMA